MAKKKETKGRKKNPEGTKVKRELTFGLTAEETRVKAMAAAKLAHQHATVLMEFKEKKEEYKSRLTDVAAKRDELLTQIRQQTEKRTVQAVMVRNFEAHLIEYWFDGTKMEERSMKSEDRQDEMKLLKGGKKDEKKKPAPVTQLRPGNGKDNVQKKETKADRDKRETAEVIAQETSRSTKHSSVDGPRGKPDGIYNPPQNP